MGQEGGDDGEGEDERCNGECFHAIGGSHVCSVTTAGPGVLTER
jgi:hypothetical protein